VGRLDDQVKIRGFRIELGEIESALLSCPGVREALVLAREDEPGDKRLVAYLVAQDASQEATETHAALIEPARLREHLGIRLPGYMIPSAFVVLDSLPLTPNGKIDRKALPKPDSARPQLQHAFQPPQTPAQITLARIWRDVLRLDEVGIHDNFFELGGDSILSIQIIARANAAGLTLTPKQVFQHQSIAQLASVAGTHTLTAAEQGTLTGSVPLTPIQHWFFEQERQQPHHFNQARLLLLQPEVSFEVVREVLLALVSHHDALRLRFSRLGSGWVGEYAREQSADFLVRVDLSGVSAGDRSAAITQVCTELQGSLNYEVGPLLRAGYLDLGEGEPSRLLLAIHHLGVDGVSWRVLLEDLGLGLGEVLGGSGVVLPAKTSSFRQWSQQLLEYAHSPELEAERAYWEGVCSAPGSKPRPATALANNVAASEGVVRVSLNEPETQYVLTGLPAVYHTRINDVLLTALLLSYHEWSGEASLLVDLEGHGREPLFEGVDISRTVGWFTSLYPVRLEWSGGEDVGTALKRVKEMIRQVPHQGIGYGVLRYLTGRHEVVNPGADSDAHRETNAGSGSAASGEADFELGKRDVWGVNAEVVFNYHGQVDGGAADTERFSRAPESAGLSYNLQQRRSHVLEVIGQVRNGCLQMAFVYSESIHSRLLVEALASGYLRALRSLIAHCQAPDAGGYTPSDFPKARVSQKSLDRLLSGIRKK
jgi:non-ribosomal peptide synthase protein (TIGR01720 family)